MTVYNTIRELNQAFLDGKVSEEYFNTRYDELVAESVSKLVDDTDTYYQPTIMGKDGSWELPDDLYSFDVFRTKEECEEWLEDNGYDPLSANITQYHNNDIEEPRFVY